MPTQLRTRLMAHDGSRSQASQNDSKPCMGTGPCFGAPDQHGNRMQQGSQFFDKVLGQSCYGNRNALGCGHFSEFAMPKMSNLEIWLGGRVL